jgi:toxin-antitoxin system PIN domain toxin
MPKSTRSFLFPDINVWIALTYEGHVHHRHARGWFGTLASSAHLFFCRFTQLGLLRLLTSEAVMGRDDIMNQDGAWEAYDQWLHDRRVAFLDEPAGLDAQFRAATRRLRQPAPKDWADSYLAAFADASDFTVVTFDQAFHTKARSVLLLKP